jgi:phosphotransferase system HPr (HPr) family protein
MIERVANAVNPGASAETIPATSVPPAALRRTITVVNPQGLHLRPAAAFAKRAREFAASVQVLRDDRAVNGKSQLDLVLLAAEPGTELIIEVSGPDAESAIEALAELLAGTSAEDEE